MENYCFEFEELFSSERKRERECEEEIDQETNQKKTKYLPTEDDFYFSSLFEELSKERGSPSVSEDSPSKSESIFEDSPFFSFDDVESYLHIQEKEKEDFLESILDLNHHIPAKIYGADLRITFQENNNTNPEKYQNENQQESIEENQAKQQQNEKITIEESYQPILYTLEILKRETVKDLRLIAEDHSFRYGMHYHWTWLQKKADLIQLILDPKNPNFSKKNCYYYLKN